MVPHEFGHALVGMALGFRSHYIVLGMGPTLATWKLRKFEIELMLFPFGGLTFGLQTIESKWRLAGFKEVYNESEQPIDRGISALYLAVLARRKNDLEGAKLWGKRARYHYPSEWVIARLADEGIPE